MWVGFWKLKPKRLPTSIHFLVRPSGRRVVLAERSTGRDATVIFPNHDRIAAGWSRTAQARRVAVTDFWDIRDFRRHHRDGAAGICPRLPQH